MKAHFQDLASYSAWANERLYLDARALPEALIFSDVGLYFDSLFGTLSHLLQTDRAWTYILQGGALDKMALPAAPDNLSDLHAARTEQDGVFTSWIGSLDEDWFGRPFSFVSGLGAWKGLTYSGVHAGALAHVLNHQTHHRGQAHAALTILGLSEPRALDLLVKGFLEP